MINNYAPFLNKTEIDFSATNYKFLESENVGAKRISKYRKNVFKWSFQWNAKIQQKL